ncbi:MAG: sulfatase [Pseudomonadota bacterium]
MGLSPRPPPVPAARHLLRLLGWMVVFEYLTGVVLSPGEASRGALGWLALAGVVAFGVGLVAGWLLDRVPPLARRPEAVLALGAAGLAALGRVVDHTWLLAGLPTLCAVLAWLRWRFPGQPGRGRSVFRLVFFTGLVVLLLGLGLRTRRPWSFAEGAVPRGPSVLVVVLDTVRRDHCSAFGYPRETTPNLAALARRGQSWRAWAHACWSLPGHGTILTGRYAGAHGANYEGMAFAEGERTTAGVFGAAGYDTLLVTANPWLRDDNGLAADFGALVAAWERTVTPAAFLLLRTTRGVWDLDRDKGGAAGARAFGRWLDARPDAARPFFALVNVMEAHAPYGCVPPAEALRFLPAGWTAGQAKALGERVLALQMMGGAAPAGEEAARVVDLYDGAVHAADAVLGRLLAQLEARGQGRDTLVVVLSDHGEFLGEHGLWGHTQGLYPEVLEVPLVAAGPGVVAGTCGGDTARLIDVAPTLLALAGLGPDALPAVHGRPLGQASAEAPVLAEQFRPRLMEGAARPPLGDLGAFAHRRFSLIEGGVELLVEEGEAPRWLGRDGELLAAPPVGAPTEERLAALRAAAGADRQDGAEPAPADRVLDGFNREALRALGYLAP